MCCLFTILLFLGPRIASVVWWIIRPVYWANVFPNIILPILGIIFLPWTTLMYAIVFPGWLNVFEWILLGFAVLIDLGAYFGGGYGNWNRFR